MSESSDASEPTRGWLRRALLIGGTVVLFIVVAVWVFNKPVVLEVEPRSGCVVISNSMEERTTLMPAGRGITVPVRSRVSLMKTSCGVYESGDGRFLTVGSTYDLVVWKDIVVEAKEVAG